MSAGLPIQWAQRSRPIPGEAESGDVHLVVPLADGVLLAAIDGLGHGREAAAAARLAADTLRARPALAPAEQIARCHAALKGTRGAAMLVVAVSVSAAIVRWAGVGNVEAWCIGPDKREAMISRAGVVGYQIATPVERSCALAPGDLLVLASDGISSRFLDAISADGDVDQMASDVLSAHARPSDDALILIARYAPGADR